MPLDAATLTGLVTELKPVTENARIDKIFQPGKDEFLFLLRSTAGNVRLLVTANPAHPRIQLTNSRRENPANPPMFCMLLRKYLSGGRILSLTQPPMERLVRLEVETRNELGDTIVMGLVLECMGRRANLILTGPDGHIVDCLRRVDPEMSEQRPVLPGLLYRLPPVSEDKTNPLSLSEEALRALLEGAPRERKVTDWLMDHFTGLSPLLCRELACQGAGSVDARVCDLSEGGRTALLQTLWGFFEAVRTGKLTPCALYREGVPKDFSCLWLYQYGLTMECRRFERFSDLLDEFYSERERMERVRSRGQELLKTLNNARNRTARKIAQQEKEKAAAEDREQYRVYGELITANLYRMERGAKALDCENYYDPELKTVHIPLDPLLTPQQNAAKYFKRYNKAKTAHRVLTEQLEKGRRELAYLESVQEAVSRCEGERDLSEIRQELEDTGYVRKKKAGPGKKAPKRVKGTFLEFRSSSGLRISVGRNNTQNDLLTCKQADRRDWWFHTQKIHGAHVILWCAGQEPDLQSVTEAAILAATYSQGSEGSHVPVDYTQVRYVKKPAGARPGMVIYTTYQTAYVDPDRKLADRLRLEASR
jgi:predicted ribosome quality control (RQC) complex YloA/Tae2 family protein